MPVIVSKLSLNGYLQIKHFPTFTCLSDEFYV